MKNLIYQNWTGDLTSETRASMENIKAYAERIGAAYRFDQDPTIASSTFPRKVWRQRKRVRYCYECLNMLVDDSFLEYDNVLSLDMDIFAVDGLAESIFDIPFGDLGICTEPSQPKLRRLRSEGICTRNDEKWAAVIRRKWEVDVPRTDEGLMKVYNTGVVLFSRQGILKARERFVPFADYVAAMRGVGILLPRWMLPHRFQTLPSFYWLEQPYTHAMMLYAGLDWTELHNGWNSLLRHTPEWGYVDERTAETRLVHIQVGQRHYDADTLWRITNLPSAEWNI